jgi:hypothetical protein
MDITELITLVTAAQKDLRSTTRNWGEACLFACDDKLTGALQGLETLRAELQTGRADLESETRWAQQYATQAEALRAKVAELEAGIDTRCQRVGCFEQSVGEFTIYAGDTRLGSTPLCIKHAAEEALKAPKGTSSYPNWPLDVEDK